MNEQREEIFLGNYTLTDFVQTNKNKVTVTGRKVDFSDLEKDVDLKEMEKLLNQLDLWESFTSSVILINKILKEEKINEISLENFYRPDKYDFESWIDKKNLIKGIPNDTMGIHINYSKVEARRRTMGSSDFIALSKEEVKNKIKNLKKWIALKTVIQFLRTV